MSTCSRLVFFFAIGSSLLGCERDDEIRVYSAPKDTEVPAVSSLSETHDAHWTVPNGWTPLPNRSFSVATFAVSPDDGTTMVTVSPLGPESGQLLPNVTRWQRQLGLPIALAESEISKVAVPFDLPTGRATRVDLTGPSPAAGSSTQQRMIAVIVPHGERVWFFKIAGAATTVEAQRDNFEAFVRSVHFEGGNDVAARFDGIEWNASAGWVLDAPKPMRVATYRTGTPDAAGAAELIITRFEQGRVGTLLDNINRWRGLAGLEAVAREADQSSEQITIGGSDGRLFDFDGPKAHMMLAMVQHGSDVWFFRFTGPADVVARQRASFDAFLKSVQFK